MQRYTQCDAIILGGFDLSIVELHSAQPLFVLFSSLLVFFPCSKQNFLLFFKLLNYIPPFPLSPDFSFSSLESPTSSVMSVVRCFNTPKEPQTSNTLAQIYALLKMGQTSFWLSDSLEYPSRTERSPTMNHQSPRVNPPPR